MVITPSVENGALVLCHELDRSITEIGGIDGGYLGVTAATSPGTIGGVGSLYLAAPGIMSRVERMVMSF